MIFPDSVTRLYDRFIFPAVDSLLIGPLRHPCTQLSAVVRDLTGWWIRPGWWVVDGVLLLVLAVLLSLRRRERNLARNRRQTRTDAQQ